MSEDVRSDFAAAFAGPQTLVDADERRVQTRVVRIGALPLPSGTVAVGDPLTGLSQLSFGDTPAAPALTPPAPLPPRPHPVDLCVATFDNADQRVACARLLFRDDAPAVRWEHTGGGAGVDSGHAGFADGGDLARWDDESFLEELSARAEALDGVPTWDAWCGALDGTHLALFSSGWGDGIYGALWGFSAEGALVELVLDFDLLTAPVVEVLALGVPGRGRFEHPSLTETGVTVEVPWLSIGRSLTIRWTREPAWPRWRLPDGRFARITARAMKQHEASYSLAGAPEGAELTLAVVRGWAPMRKA